MIHVNDQDFKGQVEQRLPRSLLLTHTSTSPELTSIIARFDVGRPSGRLEALKFVQARSRPLV